MKFIFVNILIGMYRGGGENFDLHLSRELAGKGHEIEFHFLQPVFGSVRLVLPAYSTAHPVRAPWLYLWTQRLHSLPLIGRIRGLRGLPRWVGQKTFELRILFRLWRRRREEFVVHVCGLSFLSMMATRLLGDRVFVRFPGPPGLHLDRWCIRNTYAVIANGDAFNLIERKVPGANLIRLEVGVDHGVFHRTQERALARRSLGLPEDKILALFVGRLVAVKNVHMLLRAMDRVVRSSHDIDLLVVGSGPDREVLEQSSYRLGLRGRVHFLGEACGWRLRTCYAAADVFVLASRYDNFPNVIIEAMAMELPVIATNVGGIPSQVLPNETGYLVDPDDHEALAAKLTAMAADPAMRTSLGRRAAEIARERYDWSRTAASFAQHARRALESVQ